MREYTISRMASTEAWDKIPALPIDHYQWSDAPDIRAQAKIAYDDDCLYVNLRAWEREIRAEHIGRPHQIADDSCLEFFFCPIRDDRRYFNIELNPNGAMYLGFGSNLNDLVRLLVADEQALFRIRPYRTEDGWGVKYCVPFAFIRRFMPKFSIKSGDWMRANCYKCGDKTIRPHYIAWNPLTSATPAFHRPDDFGRMIFE